MTDLTSPPLSPFSLTPRARAELRIALAKAADLYRMDGKLKKAEGLYRQAAAQADGGAKAHLIRLSDHCKQIMAANKAGRKF